MSLTLQNPIGVHHSGKERQAAPSHVAVLQRHGATGNAQRLIIPELCFPIGRCCVLTVPPVPQRKLIFLSFTLEYGATTVTMKSKGWFL